MSSVKVRYSEGVLCGEVWYCTQRLSSAEVRYLGGIFCGEVRYSDGVLCRGQILRGYPLWRGRVLRWCPLWRGRDSEGALCEEVRYVLCRGQVRYSEVPSEEVGYSEGVLCREVGYSGYSLQIGWVVGYCLTKTTTLGLPQMCPPFRGSTTSIVTIHVHNLEFPEGSKLG